MFHYLISSNAIDTRNGKFGGRSNESTSLFHMLYFIGIWVSVRMVWEMGMGVVLIIEMAYDSPNVAMLTPVSCFTVTQDLSTEDIRELEQSQEIHC